MTTSDAARSFRPHVLLGLVIALLGALMAPTPAQAAPASRPDPIVTRTVSFDLVNSSGGLLPCSDGRHHQVRGRLIGPRTHVMGRAFSTTVNVLVHDAGTDGRFWTTGGRRYNYAKDLARRGHTSLVLDRLGYGRSPLADGQDTCVDAQVSMLHQVVQHLYSGHFRASGRTQSPHASHVVLHGHGTGATLAQLESERYSDVSALVLVSPVTSRPTSTAREVHQRQATVCARGADYAPFGTRKQFDSLLFASAPRRVRTRAYRLRSATPCGDVMTTAPAVARASRADSDAQVLVLRGGRDARSSGAYRVSTTGGVTERTFRRAGNALPLERQAPAVRRSVHRFLEGLDPRRF